MTSPKRAVPSASATPPAPASPTPGPWLVDATRAARGYVAAVGVCFSERGGNVGMEVVADVPETARVGTDGLANARLIAAAPDLAALAQRVRSIATMSDVRAVADEAARLLEMIR